METNNQALVGALVKFQEWQNEWPLIQADIERLADSRSRLVEACKVLQSNWMREGRYITPGFWDSWRGVREFDAVLSENDQT